MPTLRVMNPPYLSKTVLALLMRLCPFVMFAQTVQKMAADGDTAAERKLGVMYMTGKDVPQNYKLGFQWIYKSALSGDPIAQRDLAIIYLFGRGVPQSDQTAFEWYWQAAEHGDVSSQIRMGDWYVSGRGVTADPVVAYAWLLVLKHTGDTKVVAAISSIEVTLLDEQKAEGQQLANAWDSSKNKFIPVHSSWFAMHSAQMHSGEARKLAVAAGDSSCESGHWISSVMKDGELIKLDDGGLWRVDDVDTVDSSLWLTTDSIIVCDGKLINTDENESVEAQRIH